MVGGHIGTWPTHRSLGRIGLSTWTHASVHGHIGHNGMWAQLDVGTMVRGHIELILLCCMLYPAVGSCGRRNEGPIW